MKNNNGERIVVAGGIELDQVSQLLPKRELGCSRGNLPKVPVVSGEVVMGRGKQQRSKVIYACGLRDGANGCRRCTDGCESDLRPVTMGVYDMLQTAARTNNSKS